VLVLAQEEARQLNHNFIGTEHILLGLIHEGEGVAAKVLDSLGITLEAVRGRVEEAIGTTSHTPTGSPPFTPRAKKVLELSLREALQLGHSYIGTEHMLLGIVREGDGVAAQVLVSLGADLGRVRQQVMQMMSGYQSKEAVGSHDWGVLFSGRYAEDTLLLKLLWNSNMIREPHNEAEQSIWAEVKERIESSSTDEP
jgi:ATP-dependent Clp protease ATP-binding subunit ClpC